jgi:hypothetical protein
VTGLGPSGMDDALADVEWERAARQAVLDGWCARGHHYFVRRGDVWACRNCAEPAPKQPGVRDGAAQ